MVEADDVDPFDNFAREPFYREENARLVRLARLSPEQLVIDLACGTGNISELMAPILGPDGEIYAIDMSRRALNTAQRNLAGISTPVHFIQERAENLLNAVGQLRGRVNKVICGNSIHNFEDKDGVISIVNELLVAEGDFAFNTTFFKGATTPEQDKSFYKTWLFKTMRIASRLLQERNLARETEDSEKVEARRDVSIDDYVEKLGKFGFKVRALGVRAIRMPLEAFEAISEDYEFVKGTLPRFPYEVARDALQQAVRDLFAEKDLDYSERKWLLVAAYKNT